MPITARPDPNNPGKWIWVDSATGEPAVQPGGPNTTFVAPSDLTSLQRQQLDARTRIAQRAATGTGAPVTDAGGVQVPAAGNVDPNAGVARSSPGTVQPTPVSPSAGPDDQVNQIIGQTEGEIRSANDMVNTMWDQIQQYQDHLLSLDPNDVNQQNEYNVTSRTLDQLYSSMGQAESRLGAAAQNRAALLANIVGPRAQAEAKNALAQADQASATADNLRQGAEGNRALVANQAGEAAARTKLTQAQADLQNATTPEQVKLLQSQVDEASQRIKTAQAQQQLVQPQVDNLNAQTAAINAKIGPDVALTNAQAASNNASAALSQAQADAVKLKTPVEVQYTQAQAGLAGATTAETLSKIEQAKLGPVYGLQDQINAILGIRDQIFGPGGSGANVDQLRGRADDLLQQYVSSALGGTSPYAASVAAANAGQNIYQTQAALANQASQAAASRANAFTGFGGNVLATLAAMNANAPAGSTAAAGAFEDVMNLMANRLQTPQFAAPPQPPAPQLPAFLQSFANPAAGAALPGGTTAPVTINIGGGGQPSTAPSVPLNQPTPVAGVTPPAAAPQSAPNPSVSSYTNPGLNVGAMPGAGAGGAQSTPLPSYLQGMASPTMDFIHQLWSKELSDGTVSSPYATAGAGA